MNEALTNPLPNAINECPAQKRKLGTFMGAYLSHKDSSFPMVALVLGAKHTDLHEIVQINV